MTDNRSPYRVVEIFNQGWHPTGGKDEEPVYETFTGLHGERIPGRTLDESLATRAPLRPVENVTDEDVATLRALFAEAGGRRSRRWPPRWNRCTTRSASYTAAWTKRTPRTGGRSGPLWPGGQADGSPDC